MNSITKFCKACGVEKNISDFYFNKRYNYPHYQCKSCENKRVVETRRNNPESRAKAVIYTARWKKKNPEKVREQKKSYVQRNIDKVKATASAWAKSENGKKSRKLYSQSERGKESMRIGKKKWIQSPTGKIYVAIQNHVRRSKTHGKFTPTEWINLCSKYDNRCLCCGEQKKLTVDHVIPIALGGANTIDNLQPLCLSCNSRKNKKIIDYRKDSQ